MQVSPPMTNAQLLGIKATVASGETPEEISDAIPPDHVIPARPSTRPPVLPPTLAHPAEAPEFESEGQVMRRYSVARVGVAQAIYLTGILYAIFGLLFSLIFIEGKISGRAYVQGLSISYLLGMVLGYAVFSGLLTGFVALIYNLSSKWFGGYEIYLLEKPLPVDSNPYSRLEKHNKV